MLATAYAPRDDVFAQPEQETALDLWLVEDQAADAGLMRAALKVSAIAYRLTLLQRGDELLHRVQNSPLPDLIMLDLGLPGLNGFDTLEELSKMSADIRAIPIVILTGYQDFEYIEENFPLCIVDYLNKPCDAQKVKELLQSVQHSAVGR